MRCIPRSQTRIRVATPRVNPGSDPVQPPRQTGAFTHSHVQVHSPSGGSTQGTKGSRRVPELVPVKRHHGTHGTLGHTDTRITQAERRTCNLTTIPTHKRHNSVKPKRPSAVQHNARARARTSGPPSNPQAREPLSQGPEARSVRWHACRDARATTARRRGRAVLIVGSVYIFDFRISRARDARVHTRGCSWRISWSCT